MMQLDLFLNETETLKEELAKQKVALGNVRRGLFARHNEMGKEILKLKLELDAIKTYVGYKEKQTEIVELMLFDKEKVS